MPSDNENGRLQRLKEWWYELVGTELPCGCIARDGRGARFSDYTTVTNRDLRTISVDKYRNCTRRDEEWIITIECDQCGGEWDEHHSGPRCVDYGDPNPDAERELETHWRGRRWIHEDKPVVRNSDR